jgi:hypothetical protein
VTGGLVDAIEVLYGTFARVPRPRTIDYCPCCFSRDEERALLAPVPLRHLPSVALQPYAADVMLTVGAVADFRYFLPRLLEIACDDGFGWPDMEPLFSRLRIARWSAWQDEERIAVQVFLRAAWDSVRVGDLEESYHAETVLCAVGNVEEDLAPYLATWSSTLARPTAAAQLRHLLQYGSRLDGTTRRLINAF